VTAPTPITGFDRLRARTSDARDTADAGLPIARRSDPQGRRSLYSVAGQPPALGAVTVDCSSCQRISAVTPRQLLWLAVPSLHLPLIRRRHPSWLRCPACHKRTWVRLSVRL
jgi:hypothetical protein